MLVNIVYLGVVTWTFRLVLYIIAMACPKEKLENWFSLHPADMDKVPLNIYPLLCI